MFLIIIFSFPFILRDSSTILGIHIDLGVYNKFVLVSLNVNHLSKYDVALSCTVKFQQILVADIFSISLKIAAM